MNKMKIHSHVVMLYEFCHAQVMGQYEEIVEVGAGGCRQEHSGPEELEVATKRERLPKEYSSYALSK